MAMAPRHDAVQRFRLEALTLVANLRRLGAPKAIDRADHSVKVQLERLRDISGELRRIAAKETTPDVRREAATLATLVDDAREQFDKPSA
jgi:hypothetical protein